MATQSPTLLYCWACGRYMNLVRVTPAFGGLPELDTFKCTGCGDIQTVEVLPRCDTSAPSLEQAKAKLRAAFETWLAWALAAPETHLS
jgi:hypothetical protein